MRMLGFEWKCFDAQRLYFWPISQGQKMDHQAKTDKTFQTIHFLFKNSIKPKKISRIRIVQRTVVQFADFFNKCSLSLQIGRTHDKTNVIICISVFIISIDLYVDNSYVFMKQKISIIYVDIFIHIYRERHIHRDFFPEPLEINLYTSLKKNPKYINVYFLKLKIRFSGKESSCQCRRCRR